MHKELLPVIAVVLLLISCTRKTELEKAANALHAGMYQTNVARLFASFEQSVNKAPGNDFDVFSRLFQSNATFGTEVRFAPTNFNYFLDPLEVCYVYFDTNNKIAAYYYSRDDGRKRKKVLR